MMNIFQQLREVKSFTTEQNQDGLITRGSGQVLVTEQSDNTIVFNEHGQRQLGNGNTIDFTNSYCWQILDNDELSLSHLRLSKPVHLLDFTQRGQSEWHTKKPHVCGQDIYSATLTMHEHTIHLQWNIQGPHKAINIDVMYY